jgi:ribonuclease E
MAAIGGDLPGLALPLGGDGEVDDAQAEAEGDEALRSDEDGRRSRRRRRGRGGRNGERSERGERGDRSEDAPARSGRGSWVRSSDHAEPDFAVERAPADLAHGEPWSAPAPTAQTIEIRQPSSEPVASAPAPQPEPAPQAASEPAAAPALAPAPAPAREPDPLPEAPAPAEKKSGWWSRAKTTFTGG